MNRLWATIVERNTEFRDGWHNFESHRQRVTSLLVSCFSAPQPAIALWGAGNCNDVDLGKLAQSYRTVHLVDIDENALQAARDRQQGLQQQLVLHAPIDLMGVFDELSKMSANGTDQHPVVTSQLIEAAREAPCPAVHEPVDVAASLCLLTQLIEAVRISIGDDHPKFFPLVEAIRIRHLRLLLERVRPGGVAMLITDLVSSESASEIATTPGDQFRDYVAGLVRAGNFFTGVNPFLIMELFHKEAALVPMTDRVQLIQPWKWNLGPRWYAVTAIKVIRK